MAFLPGEAGGQEYSHDIEHQFCSDYTGSKTQDIHVIVLNSLVRGVGVMAHAGTDTAYLVCRDRDADTAAAYQQPTITSSAHHLLRNRDGIVGVIIRLGRIMCSQVGDFVSKSAKFCNGDIVERNTSMVCAHSYLHFDLICTRPAVPRKYRSSSASQHRSYRESRRPRTVIHFFCSL